MNDLNLILNKCFDFTVAKTDAMDNKFQARKEQAFDKSLINLIDRLQKVMEEMQGFTAGHIRAPAAKVVKQGIADKPTARRMTRYAVKLQHELSLSESHDDPNVTKIFEDHMGDKTFVVKKAVVADSQGIADKPNGRITRHAAKLQHELSLVESHEDFDATQIFEDPVGDQTFAVKKPSDGKLSDITNSQLVEARSSGSRRNAGDETLPNSKPDSTEELSSRDEQMDIAGISKSMEKDDSDALFKVPRPVPALKPFVKHPPIVFDDLRTDDETDDEGKVSAKRTKPFPGWSQMPRRQVMIIKQNYINSDGKFGF